MIFHCSFVSETIPGLTYCAAAAAIWAEQQSGWLREDQNARLHQEEHFASIKEPRSPTNKKNKAKKKNYLLRGRLSKMATQALPPSTPVATFGPKPASFQRK
jgi:hypothetical protein